jgi:Concanavalin A-like lectin/glucanases superfamily
MVLTRLGWLCVLACAACSQSLFDAHGPGGGGGGGGDDGGGTVPMSCPDPCTADAAKDFNGSATGTNQRWRYLDDHRDRTWAAMTPAGNQMTGADARNHITTCSASSSAAACHSLPGALLMSSAGVTTPADPAIEFTVPSNQVLQLTVRVFVPGDADQQIVVYRGSREDVLYRAAAAVGQLVEHTITLDALAGDRFLFTLAPIAKGASDVAVQLFASDTGQLFPQSCQLALLFEGASGNTVTDQCKSAVFDSINGTDASDTPTPVVTMPGPYAEERSAVSLSASTTPDGKNTGDFLRARAPLDQTHDLTVQMWAKLRAKVPLYDNAWLFSDTDYDLGGGVAIGLFVPDPPDPAQVLATTCTDPNAPAFKDSLAGYPDQAVWHFVRVVHTGGMMNLCLDGKKVASAAIADDQLKSVSLPHLGKNGKWLPVGAFFDGLIDDVRVITGALPCE